MLTSAFKPSFIAPVKPNPTPAPLNVETVVAASANVSDQDDVAGVVTRSVTLCCDARTGSQKQPNVRLPPSE